MYTKHGWQIPHTDVEPWTGRFPINCGGVEKCVDCAREAIQYLPIEPDEGETGNPGLVEPITQGFPDEDLQKLLAEEEEQINAEKEQLGRALLRELKTEDRLRRIDRSGVGLDELARRFNRREETEETTLVRQAVHSLFLDGASILDKILPNGRSKFQALMQLELGCMWANKAIDEMAPMVDVMQPLPGMEE